MNAVKFLSRLTGYQCHDRAAVVLRANPSRTPQGI